MQIAAGCCKIGFVNQSFIVKVHEAYRLPLTGMYILPVDALGELIAVVKESVGVGVGHGVGPS